MSQVYWQQAFVMVTSSSRSEGTDCFHVGLQEASSVSAGLCCAHQAFRRLGASVAPHLPAFLGQSHSSLWHSSVLALGPAGF